MQKDYFSFSFIVMTSRNLTRTAKEYISWRIAVGRRIKQLSLSLGYELRLLNFVSLKSSTASELNLTSRKNMSRIFKRQMLCFAFIMLDENRYGISLSLCL
jgi:hypothetical protein